MNNPADQFYIPDEDVVCFNERYEKMNFPLCLKNYTPFTHQEITKAISLLRTNKSAGADKLLNDFS